MICFPSSFRPHVLGVALCVLLAACSPSTSSDEHASPVDDHESDSATAAWMAEGLWIRPALENRSTGIFGRMPLAVEVDTLVHVEAGWAGRVEMHQGVVTPDGLVGMRRMPFIPGADGAIDMAPRGSHLMVFELERAIAEGDTVSITATFSSGTAQTYEAIGASPTSPVRAPAARPAARTRTTQAPVEPAPEMPLEPEHAPEAPPSEEPAESSELPLSGSLLAS